MTGATLKTIAQKPGMLTPAQALAVVESWLAAVEASAPPAHQLHYGIHLRRSLPALEEVLYHGVA